MPTAKTRIARAARENEGLTLEPREVVEIDDRIVALETRNHELTEALVRAQAAMDNAAGAMERETATLKEAALAAYREWDRK